MREGAECRILLKRADGVERQYRFYCRQCRQPLGYRPRPQKETSRWAPVSPGGRETMAVSAAAEANSPTSIMTPWSLSRVRPSPYVEAPFESYGAFGRCRKVMPC